MNAAVEEDVAPVLLRLLRRETRTYQSIIRDPVTAQAEGREPEPFCRELLARIEPRLPGDAPVWRRIADRLGASANAPALVLVLAALTALDDSAFEEAVRFAGAAMAADQRDIFVQELLRRAARSMHGTEDPADDLAQRFCSRPFDTFELHESGDVYACCVSWLPAPIGNFRRQSAEAIWNSPTAQEIRRSILDGDFRHCSRIYCPYIVERKLPKRAEVKDPWHRRIIDERLTAIDRMPRRVLMSQDRSCNLSCPSCRTQPILARKAEQDDLNALAETVILPLLRDARKVKITGSGDPFASGHFRYLMKRLDPNEFPRLRLQLQTNGLLLDERAWNEIGLDGKVESIWVSIDAATEATYASLRRGGDFGRLLDNLVFMADLRKQNRVGFLRLDTVVQAANFREMPAIVEIGMALGFDRVHFQLIRNWGTFSREEFMRHAIGAPDHPDHKAFLEVLEHPNLGRPLVSLGELSSLRRGPVPATRAWWA
ncbi:MAG: SPASM domain-containing protein [Geminicoccaceae bacterium]